MQRDERFGSSIRMDLLTGGLFRDVAKLSFAVVARTFGTGLHAVTQVVSLSQFAEVQAAAVVTACRCAEGFWPPGPDNGVRIKVPSFCPQTRPQAQGQGARNS